MPGNNGLRIVDALNGDDKYSKRAIKRERRQRGRRRDAFEQNEEEAIEDGKPIVYPPQKEMAAKIYQALCTNVLLFTVCAPMQWGKTGIVVYLAYLALAKSRDVRVLKMVIITGMSDKAWEKQTKERFECLEDNGRSVLVFHAGALGKQKELFQNLSDAIIVIDECHYGNGMKQRLGKLLKKAGILDPDLLINRNVRIVQISATPDSSIVVPQSWKEEGIHKKVVVDWRAKEYISPKDIVDQGRLYDPVDLTKMDNVRREIGNVNMNGLIIVRAPSKSVDRAKVLNNLKKFQVELS